MDMTYKEKVWAKSHKCRKCNKGLPLTRYFNCEDCVELQPENEWDSFDDHDFDMGDSVAIHMARVRDSKVTEMFIICNSCEREKPRNEYHFMARKKNGRSGHCKECNAARLRKYQVAKHAS